MRFINKISITFFGLLFLITEISAQEKVILKTYLPTIEKHFGVTFSYLEENVINEILPLNFQGHSLFSVMSNLEKQTKLKFQRINSKQYSIRTIQPNDRVSVCGYIKDQFGSPQHLVTINTSGINQSIPVADDGYFTVEAISYGSVIRVQGQNFSLRTISVKELFQPQCLTVTVYSRKVKLKEVVVANYLSKGFKVAQEKVVFKPNEFEVLAGLTTPDIMQAIQQVPGVISPFESASRIFIRGGTPDQNLVRWNGITTYNQSHFFGLLSAFNPYVIDEVDFYKKTVNAKYGGRVGGLIDMKTSDRVVHKFSGGTGSNLLHADIFAKIPLIKNKLSITLSGRRSFTDFWESPTYRQLSKRIFQNTRIEAANEAADDFFFYDATLTINAKPSLKDKLQANILVSKNDLNFSNVNDLESQQDKLVTQSTGYSLNWQHNWNKRWKYNLNIFNSRYLLDYSFLLNESKGEGRDKEMANTRTNFVNDFGGETSFSYQKANQSISIGINFAKNNVRYAFETQESGFDIQLDQDRNRLTTIGSFVDYTYEKPKNYKLSLGIRSTSYSIAKSQFFEPRIYAEKSLGNFLINLSYNKQTQAITQIRESEFSTLSLENLVWRATDDEFEVINSNHYNFGGNYKKNKWFIEAEAYYKEVENIATFSSGFLNILNTNRSIGESRTFGAELFVKRKFQHFESWVSYTFLNQKNRFISLNSNRFFKSNINIDHTFKWVTLFRWKQWNASTSWLLHSGKTTTLSNFQKVEGEPVRVDFSVLQSGQFPIYHRLDASVKYRFKQKKNTSLKYELGFSVQNAYNFQTTINREFRISPGIDNQLLTFDYTSLGITPNLSFRISW